MSCRRVGFIFFPFKCMVNLFKKKQINGVYKWISMFSPLLIMTLDNLFTSVGMRYTKDAFPIVIHFAKFSHGIFYDATWMLSLKNKWRSSNNALAVINLILTPPFVFLFYKSFLFLCMGKTSLWQLLAILQPWLFWHFFNSFHLVVC